MILLGILMTVGAAWVLGVLVRKLLAESSFALRLSVLSLASAVLAIAAWDASKGSPGIVKDMSTLFVAMPCMVVYVICPEFNLALAIAVQALLMGLIGSAVSNMSKLITKK